MSISPWVRYDKVQFILISVTMMVNRIWTTTNSVFWLASSSQIKKKFTMLPNDSSLFFTFWWKKNCSISFFFMLYRKLSINGIATTISIAVFCLQNLIRLNMSTCHFCWSGLYRSYVFRHMRLRSFAVLCGYCAFHKRYNMVLSLVVNYRKAQI